MKSIPKALALISGGLDSLLAARVVQDHGVQVEGINFYTGFCVEGHTQAIRKRDPLSAPRRNNALWAAERLGIRLHIVDVVEEYQEVVLNPRYGYGANLNPCLDCKIFMVRKAADWMERHGFDFLVSGEVVGQRPKSQCKVHLPLVQQESGIHDRLLRPLCARKLPPTLPERMGWVERDRLHAMYGRSRKPQIALAEDYAIADYAQPAGGCCFLTDPNYSVRLADLWKSRGDRRYALDDVILLKVGRHIRPAAHYKLIVAREAGESNYLAGYRQLFPSLEALSHNGPYAIIDGAPNPADIQLAARILARYSQGRDAAEVEIQYRAPQGASSRLRIRPLSAADIPGSWIL